MDDAGEIAGKLTAAQREVLRDVSKERDTPSRLGCSTATANALVTKGLCIAWVSLGVGWYPREHTHYRLTNRGLAVRAILQKDQ